MMETTKYVRVKEVEKQKDPTEMSREELFARIEEARRQIERGECVRFSNREEMKRWLDAL